MAKLLSIIIPVYNTEKYISKCVDSIISEEIKNCLEIILVNDGSKDSSLIKLNSYKKKFPSIVKVINKENGGHGSTINEGLKIAKGKYIKVIDSDDWVEKKNFILFIKELEHIDADLIVTQYTRENLNKGESILYKYTLLNSRKMYFFDTFDPKCLGDEFFFLATTTFKTSVLRKSKLHLLEKTFYVDMQLITLPMKEINTFIYLDIDVYHYLIGREDQSISLTNFVKNEEDHIKVVKDIIENYIVKKDQISKNKQNYYKIPIRSMIHMQYDILCNLDKNKRKALKQAKNFDKYLLQKDLELYNEMDNIASIYYHRKFGFEYVYCNEKMYDRLVKIYKKIYKINL